MTAAAVPKNNKHEYRNDGKPSIAADPAVACQTSTEVELFDDEGNRRYYTVDEYAENLRTAINQHYGYELIAKP